MRKKRRDAGVVKVVDAKLRQPYRYTVGGLKHRKVMEEHLGRKLRRDEIVHHKDGNKLNNDIANLQVMTRAEHDAEHNAPVNPVSKECLICGKWFTPLPANRKKQVTCSRSCGQRFNWQRRRQRSELESVAAGLGGQS